MHLNRIDDQWSLWVDTGPIGRRSDIAPFAGIRHEGIENLLAEFLGRPTDDWVGSIGANVGYLLGRGYAAWTLPSDFPLVVSAVEDALQFLRSHLDLKRLPRLWEIDGAQGPLWRYREIVVSLMCDEKESVAKELSEVFKIECHTDDEVCEQFLAFKKGVEKRLSEHN